MVYWQAQLSSVPHFFSVTASSAVRPSRAVGCIACIAAVCAGLGVFGNTVAPTTPPAINSAAADATAAASQVRRDRCCRLGERGNVVGPTLSRRRARKVGKRNGFIPAQRVEDARHPRKVRELGSTRRVGREIAFVATPILQAQRAQNIGGVPLSKVVIGLEVRHRTTPLSCNAMRNARSA